MPTIKIEETKEPYMIVKGIRHMMEMITLCDVHWLIACVDESCLCVLPNSCTGYGSSCVDDFLVESDLVFVNDFGVSNNLCVRWWFQRQP